MKDQTGHSEPRLAVLIDAENAPAMYADAIFKELATLGEASVRRVYGNFSVGSVNGWRKEILEKHALIPHHQPAYTQGKNSSDIALVIDAMDLLHSARFDGFVLVSSDSDFTRLASRIREHGLDVFGIGGRQTPEAFLKACKRFIFLENLVPEEDGPAEPLPSARQVESSPSETSTEPPLIEIAHLILTFVRKQDEDWVSLSSVGSHIRTAISEFDPRTYGCSNLSSLVEKTGAFELNRENGVSIRVKKGPKQR